MKKTVMRFAALLLVLCAIFPPGSASADDTGLCYIAVNDQLIDPLAAFYGGVPYVPYTLFGNYGITYLYDSETSTASLKTATFLLSFDMTTGKCTDKSGNDYPASAIFYGGQIYVSATGVCNYYGLSCLYIDGSGYGDILRIRNSNAVLSDYSFGTAAQYLIQSRTEAYMRDRNPASTPVPTPTPTPEPAPDRSATSVYLSFEGLPGKGVLDALSEAGIASCFFLTAEDVRKDPETVRRIAGEGHNLGVLYGGGEDFAEVSELIYDAARVRTILMSSSEDDAEACEEFAAENSLVYWSYDMLSQEATGNVAYEVITLAQLNAYRSDIRIACEGLEPDTVRTILGYLTENRFTLPLVCEVGAG